jgi:catechol 2,3-dioxygenase
VDVFATDDEGDFERSRRQVLEGAFQVRPFRGPGSIAQNRLVDGCGDFGNAVHAEESNRCQALRRHVLELSNVHTVMTIHASTRIGHVHLTVSDLDRALSFYRDVLGFEVTSRFGRDAVFLSAGGYHHHIGLNTWAGRGAPASPPGTTGLYHFAILYPDRKTLAGAVRRVLQAGVPLEGAADHGVSEAIYLRDPDGNGVELYRDRPEGEWPRAPDGSIAMHTRALDLENLLGEAD